MKSSGFFQHPLKPINAVEQFSMSFPCPSFYVAQKIL